MIWGKRNMDREAEKRLAAQQAISYVEDGSIVGVGTGSTVAHFIDELGKIRNRIEATVSSSEKSTALLSSSAFRSSTSTAPANWRCMSTAPTNAIRASA